MRKLGDLLCGLNLHRWSHTYAVVDEGARRNIPTVEQGWFERACVRCGKRTRP